MPPYGCNQNETERSTSPKTDELTQTTHEAIVTKKHASAQRRFHVERWKDKKINGKLACNTAVVSFAAYVSQRPPTIPLNQYVLRSGCLQLTTETTVELKF